MMMTTETKRTETRVLVVAPVGRDAQLTCAALAEHGLTAEACAGVAELCREVAWGAGAAFLTNEALDDDAARLLTTTLAAQPAWSDLPLVLLTGNGQGRAAPDARVALTALSQLGNVTLIERPVRVVTLVSVLRSALRARARQYEVRDQLAELAAAHAEREQLLAREQAARHEAEANNRLKDEFLATVSHELRTPLTAILGWTQFLRRGRLDAAATMHAIDVIDRNGQAQLHLIEDLLDVSRIITGKLRLDLRSVDLAVVIGAALDAVRPAAAAKEIELRTALDPAATQVTGDADRLQQVVWNLVNNAVKFTPRGGRVEVSTRQADAHISVVVADTGEGIAPEFLPHVFDRFRQADARMTRMHGGLGLGLAIVRQLVELHGGTVKAESTGAGCGATFTVSLPLHAPAQTETHEPKMPLTTSAAARTEEFAGEFELAGLRVLVVDDEADARELFAATLAGWGAEVLTAASAAEALALVERERPDALLADIGMPGEDGYALIRQVRALPPERGGRTPAAALTAYARAEDRQRALSAGFQTHMPKPIKAAELAAVVATLAGHNGAA
jgi:signal transduction histidine kinase/ActR/RegA family two-component response regulator